MGCAAGDFIRLVVFQPLGHGPIKNGRSFRVQLFHPGGQAAPSLADRRPQQARPMRRQEHMVAIGIATKIPVLPQITKFMGARQTDIWPSHIDVHRGRPAVENGDSRRAVRQRLERIAVG